MACSDLRCATRGARAATRSATRGSSSSASPASPLPTHAIHTTEDFFGHTKLRKVVVGAGKETSFRLGVTHGATSTKHCTLAYGLQVIAPNDTATLRVSIPDGVLECGSATVSPMQPGTSAYP